MTWTVRAGDCRELMAAMEENSIDAIVTDPPYALTAGKKGGSGDASVNLESPYGRARITTGFMGKKWDGQIPGVEFWTAALRVAKPGAHLLAFGGTRTHHRLICAIEDAGWEIRDCLSYLYGSGFPKSLDVSKAIDKAAGAERPVVGRRTDRAATPKRDIRGGRFVGADTNVDLSAITAPATDDARAWSGWGTALKPAWEPIVLARKPLTGTVAANVQRFGTGAINVDGCRIESDRADTRHGGGGAGLMMGEGGFDPSAKGYELPSGRWPANVALSCCGNDPHDLDCAAAMLDEQSGERTSGDRQSGEYGRLGYQGFGVGPMPEIRGDSGGASRFFFVSKGGDPCHESSGFTKATDAGPSSPASGPNAMPHESQSTTLREPASVLDTCESSRMFYTAKASRADRNDGLEGMPERSSFMVESGSTILGEGRQKRATVSRNIHPTVKPFDLMRWLCRLITPPGGTILDPFAGSGSTGVAALAEQFNFIGLEISEEYVPIAKARIRAAVPLLAEEVA